MITPDPVVLPEPARVSICTTTGSTALATAWTRSSDDRPDETTWVTTGRNSAAPERERLLRTAPSPPPTRPLASATTSRQTSDGRPAPPRPPSGTPPGMLAGAVVPVSGGPPPAPHGRQLGSGTPSTSPNASRESGRES